MIHRLKPQFATAIVLGLFGICGWVGGCLWTSQAPASSRRAASVAPARRSPFAKKTAAAAVAAPSLDANEWVRTRDGWERATWRAKPRRLPHPTVVATFLCFASLLALVAFSPVGERREPASAAR